MKMDSQKMSKCKVCRKNIIGYSNKKTCSSTCRSRLAKINKARALNDFICSQTFK